ncbi:peptidase S8/S53 domain-containing protein [Chytriomyces sp. MP71]|nr:peptidase S8/S53 domain-containing protein [Chytriomyces sp. MP71]
MHGPLLLLLLVAAALVSAAVAVRRGSWTVCEYVAHFAPDTLDVRPANAMGLPPIRVIAVRASSFATLVTFELSLPSSLDTTPLCPPPSALLHPPAFTPSPLSLHPLSLRQRPSLVSASSAPVAANNSVKFKHRSPLPLQQGVQHAHDALALSGAAIKVAIIDTGVYYLHPALGAGFGPGFKISFGSDLVGDAFGTNSNYTPIPDNDPFDNCSADSHGTHVAGIIAANTFSIPSDVASLDQTDFVPTFDFVGVAPNVSLGMFRVFGCNGSTQSDVIAHAIYLACEQGAQVINLSIGGGPAFSDDDGVQANGSSESEQEVDALAATLVSRGGCFVMASAGNDGAAGPFVTGNPGNALGAISVASFDGSSAPYSTILFNGTAFPYALAHSNSSFADGQILDIVINDPNAESSDTLDDGCSTGKSATILRPGQSLLLRWGNASICGSAKRCAFAFRSGASACILYGNNEDMAAIAGAPEIPGIFISRSAGLALLASSRPLQLEITFQQALFPIPTADTLSVFSSAGLDPMLALKPDLGGIGGSVYSTLSPYAAEQLGFHEGYGVMSGTSMAAPFVAGVAALVLEARRGLNITFPILRALLQNGALPREVFERKGLLMNAAYQGAGMVDAVAAATARAVVLPSSFALNDTADLAAGLSFTIFNLEEGVGVYRVGVVAAATAFPFLAGDDYVQDQVNVAMNDSLPATVAFSLFSGGPSWVPELQVTVGPYQSVKVYLTVTPPASSVSPIYSGYLTVVASSTNATIHVPYAGLAVPSYAALPVWSRRSPSLMRRILAPFLLNQTHTRVAVDFASTGIYPTASLVPMQAYQTVNSTAGLYVLALAAQTSRNASIRIYGYDVDMARAGFNGSSALLSLHDLAFASGSSGMGLPASWMPMPRTTFSASQGVGGATVYLWRGFAWNDGFEGGEIRVPEGVYGVEFQAAKAFGGHDVVSSELFRVVY